jgi:hypothetical protein
VEDLSAKRHEENSYQAMHVCMYLPLVNRQMEELVGKRSSVRRVRFVEIKAK